MLQATQAIALVYRNPFSLNSPVFQSWTGNASLSEIVKTVDWLPENFSEVGTVSINSHVIPRENWSKVYPRPSKSGEPVDVIFQIATQGGKQGGQGKQIFAFVAALALTFVTAGIAGGSLSKLLGAKFAAGTMGAKLAAAGVSLIGGLAVNALTSVPARADTGAENISSLNPAAIQGNVLRANSPLPTVVGTRKIFPPFLFEPIVEMIDQDEIVTAVLGLAGPHKLESVRVGDALASDDTADLQVLTYDGLPDSTELTIPPRYGKTFALSVEMSTHGTDNDDGLLYTGPAPVWHSFSTADAPDESWLHMYVTGLMKDGAETEKLRIPFRIEMRKRGDTVWRALPELQYMDCTQSPRRIQVKFIFGSAYAGSLPTPSNVSGFVEARKLSPLPGGGNWVCDAYFSAGVGNDIYRNDTPATTNVRNILPVGETVYVYLDSASWLPGIYDVRIMRGGTFQNSRYVSNAYTYDGAVTNFFDAPISGSMWISRTGLLDKVNLIRCVNVKNQPPIISKNISMIYLTARNRQIDQVSVVASGYVNDYVAGVGWTNTITTSNPAPHFRNILTGALNADPLPEAMLWEASLIDWRQFCIDNDLTCDLIIEGGSIFETMRVIASCGYASPYQSEVWGVIMDYDRSAEPPEQTFTPRNSNNYSIRKSFNRLPSGLRPNFKDADYEYSGRQIVVYADNANASDALTEQVEYLGIVDRAKIRKRAKTDLRQARLRSAIHTFNTNIASLAIRRGSLIAVSNDVIMQYQSQSARILSVTLNGSGFVTAIELDSEVTIFNEPNLYDLTDVYLVDDFFTVGLQSGIAIKNSSGALTTHKVTSATVETFDLTFVDPIEIDPDLYKTGNLVTVGILGNEYRRLIVSSIQYNERKVATIIAVDEAPEIWKD